MERGTAFFASQPTCQTIQNEAIGDIYFYYNDIGFLFQRGVKSFCLRNCPWKAIENVAFLSIGFSESVKEHLKNDFIWNKSSFFHIGFGFQANGSISFKILTEEISG